MKHFYGVSTLFWLGFAHISLGQTSNTGILYVNESTQFAVVENFQNGSSGKFYNDGEAFIYGYFNNDGVINYYGNTGLTRFLGRGIQHLSGSQESYLYNVEFNNASQEVPYQLLGSLSIEGEANFYQGIIDNNSGGMIFFGQNATHINTSHKSHVQGRVGHYGAEDFIFPVGDGGFYRYIEIADLSDVEALIETTYFLENSNDLYPHAQRPEFVETINDKEYWQIEHIGGSQTAMINLSMSELTTPSEFLTESDDETTHIIRWDETENRWIDEGGMVNYANLSVSTVIKEPGIYTLSRIVDADLPPCEFTFYNAVSPNGDGINDHFGIKTSSSSCTENLQVEIYNRWGVKVFETNNYGESGDVFDGFSRGRLNVNGNEQLPSGTYFYIVRLEYGTNEEELVTYKKAGYLYLHTN